MPIWKTIKEVGAQLGQYLPVVGSYIQGKQNEKIARENTDKTIAANKAMAEYQYSKDLEMWNRGNVYNSPDAQMARLKSAGLNPNMVYGSGSAAGMSAGQLPKYNAPTQSFNYVPPVDIPSMISQFQDFRIRNAQVRNTDEQILARQLNRKAETYLTSGYDEMAGDPLSQGSMTVMPYWMAKRESQLRKSGQQASLFPYQKEMAAGQSRKVGLENLRIMSATRNMDLKNDYFAAEAISRLFGGTVGSLAKVGTLFRGGTKGAKGALSPKTIQPPKRQNPNNWDFFQR